MADPKTQSRSALKLLFLTLALLAGGCSIQTPPAVTTQRKLVPALAGLGGPAFSLAWNYPTNWTSNLCFEIWSTDDLRKPFWETAVVWSNTWPLTVTGKCGFFKVRSSNTITGQVSPWAS